MGRINQYSYKDILEKCLKQLAKLFYGRSKSWIFQQDGPTAHTAHSIQDWFNEKGYKVFPWSSRLPDLILLSFYGAGLTENLPNIR